MAWNIVAENYMNANLIFPTKQHEVYQVIEALRVFDEVKSIIVFGSTVTPLCHIWSDIDIYVECDVGFRRPGIKTESALDIWTTEMVDKYLLDEIKKKGVIVYEK